MSAIVIVGVFDDATDARIAAQRLAECGVDPDAIRIEGGEGSTIEAPQRTGGGSLRSFFAGLFGGDDDRDDRDPDDFPGDYAEAVRRGASVVLVDTRDDAETERVVQLLDDCGAIDIDERVERWRREGYSRHDESAPPLGSEQVAAERVGGALGGAPVANEAREADAERRRRARVHRFGDAESAVYGTMGSSLRSDDSGQGAEPRRGAQRTERSTKRAGRQAARDSVRDTASAPRGPEDRPADRAVDVGGAEATGAAWSAAPGQRRPDDKSERRDDTTDSPDTGLERRGPAQ
jgi:hypothetical protein